MRVARNSHRRIAPWALPPAQPEPAKDIVWDSISKDIKAQIEDGGGFWRSCSGCHELSEGHDTGLYSDVFKCALGLGCAECGGIGAIWDSLDYSAVNEPEPAPTREETIEAGARAIALSQGNDPDGLAPRTVMCTAANEQVTWYRVFEEHSEACLDAILPLHPSPSAPTQEEITKRGIYIASKTRHADRWVTMRAAGAPIISTWIDEAGEGQSADLHDLWDRCISESKSCGVLIVYREPEDVLKGAWVEIGAALAAGVPVYAVGLDGFTLSKYRDIHHFETIDEAFTDAILALRQEPATAVEPDANWQAQTGLPMEPGK